jgi:phosphoglycolate phosphatase-like HAD superfamily hydrolase
MGEFHGCSQACFTAAFKDVFGFEDLSIDTVSHHGCTDAMVSSRTLAAAGVPAATAEARWPEVQASMLRYAEAHSADAALGLELLPGVQALLQALRTKGAVTALVTGNLAPIGWHKMQALGIRHLFSEPNFGGCVCTRACSQRPERLTRACNASSALAQTTGTAASW